MNNQQQFDALDMLSVLSLALGYQNLIENRAQSEHNDISAANERQAEYLLNELTKQFEEQNKLLKRIAEEVMKK